MYNIYTNKYKNKCLKIDFLLTQTNFLMNLNNYCNRINIT